MRTTDEGAKAGADLGDFFSKPVSALDGLADTVTEAVADQEPQASWQDPIAVVRRDAEASLCAVRLVAARQGMSSQLIDNLNANVHLRAVLTDLFLVDELVG